MTDVRLTVIDLIREVDPGDTLDASRLGAVLGQRLAPHFTDLYAVDVQRFVVEADRGRKVPASDLADGIVTVWPLTE